jgi:transcriptional activator SPT7
LGVLAHVAAEYIINLGRTLRFYSDRYGSKMSTEVSTSSSLPSFHADQKISQQILLHVLNENGVPSPAYIESYVADDIDKYGTKLQDLHGKLERARKDQLEALDGSAIGDDEVFARDGEALLLYVSVARREDI